MVAYRIRAIPGCETAITQKELAHVLGLSARRLRQLGGLLPRLPSGRYPIPDAVRSYVRYREQVVLRRTRHRAAITAAREAQARLWTAQARSIELEIDARERELLRDRIQRRFQGLQR